MTKATLDLYEHFRVETGDSLVASHVLIAHAIFSRHKTIEATAALTVPEVAKELQISEKSVYRLIKSGAIPHCWIGNILRVPARALQQFLVDKIGQSEPSASTMRLQA